MRCQTYIWVSRQSGFVTSFAITEKLIACQALLFEVQRVMSPRLPRLQCLIALFSTYCRQNRIQTLSLSPRFNGHSPCEPGLAGVY